MKTINTTLPVYDALRKQTYERVKKSHLDKKVPTLTPRHRLPSMLWNAESDDPGELKDIEIIDCDGDNIYELAFDAANGTYDTFTETGSSVACVNAAGGAYGVLGGDYDYTAYDILDIEIYLTYTSGEYPYIAMYNGGGARQGNYYTLRAGANRVFLGYDISQAVHLRVVNTDAANFTIRLDSVKKSAISHFKLENDMLTMLGWASDLGAYDTATTDNNLRNAILVKTTAAGAASYKFYDSMSTSGVSIGDKVYIYAYVVKTSGTLPKMAICKYTGDATRTPISNEVQLVDGANYIVLTATAAFASGAVQMYNATGEVVNFMVTIFYIASSTMPSIVTDTDEYFQYNGETLGELLPFGDYYLKMTSAVDFVYFSDWLRVLCIYPNLITGFTNFNYNTFAATETEITSAIETVSAGSAYCDITKALTNGEEVMVIFYLNVNSGQLPTVRIYGSATIDSQAAVAGLNVITLTSDANYDNFRFWITNSAAANFYTSEILVLSSYSEEYLTLNFSNTCDLGDILAGFEQTLWLESETLEPSFPMEE